jgi:hypothetical protein
MLVYEPASYAINRSTFGECNHLLSGTLTYITKPIIVMKPIYLLLVLMACGFFACTTDFTSDATEIAPQPEGKTLDAAILADFTSDLDDLGLFDTEEMIEADYIGIEDFRLYLQDGEFAFDFLTESDNADEDRTFEEILALRPVRNWSSSITLPYSKGDAERFQTWLIDNFAGSTHIDLRLSVSKKRSMTIRGMSATEADLEQFTDVPLFNFD